MCQLSGQPSRTPDASRQGSIVIRRRGPQSSCGDEDYQPRVKIAGARRSAPQFAAQTGSYRTQFAKARFDIIELGGERIGRIVVDRPGSELHIVDQAIVPRMRNKGLGTIVMHALMDEAAAARVPVRLTVGSSNDPSLRLYLRLGFVPTGAVPMYIEMRWTPSTA